MHKKAFLNSTAIAATFACLLAGGACAETFNIPGGDLTSALDRYMKQSGVSLMYSSTAVKGVRTSGAVGDLPARDALSRILSGTGFTVRHDASGAVAIVPEKSSSLKDFTLQLAQALPARAVVETVTVTSSKLGGADVQSIPISITALSQEQLTATQTNGGPDLIKQVPNMNFSKTNFSGYNIQIRGIGTQAISVTTDPAVAVAMNDVPFIRNHFFEQEFYDLGQVEVLRGPQGTLYGRNATAGVVNLATAKPTDQFEAMASGEIGNYQQRRFEGMINIPIVDDRLDIRVAGEWTKRQGYTFNELTDSRIDGRDLWSGRVTIGWKPTEKLQTYLIWEHFSENDDRLRSAKQVCTESLPPPTILGVPNNRTTGGVFAYSNYTSQGCQQGPLYGPTAFEEPYGPSLGYYTALVNLGGLAKDGINIYALPQSQNYRVIQSQLTPSYKAKNDTVELNADSQLTPSLTFTSDTAFNHDFLWSTQDYTRYAGTHNIFLDSTNGSGNSTFLNAQGQFCDPQLGCSDSILAMDLNNEHSWQLNQEFRVASHFSGPLNFSVGGNYMHYETEENYYVFINSISVFSYYLSNELIPGTTTNMHVPYVPGVTDNYNACIKGNAGSYSNPNSATRIDFGCSYIDPNPVSSLNSLGHNYFLSQNPYLLNSYAAFGEAYYDITKDLKLTTGLRWTKDLKHFTEIPSEFAISGIGYPITGVIDQEWGEFTGRAALNWTPKLNFTDQTLVYGSYAHGYKAGGANPPGATLPIVPTQHPVHPLTFKPEFIDAFELGSKNTLLDGSLTLNTSVFYYNYEDYQISEIVDRTAINNNFNAHVTGAEIEATWEPIPGLRFNASGGYEDARVANGESAIDLMDRTAGDPNWIVYKPFPTFASNCIIPAQVEALNLAGYNAAVDVSSSTYALGTCADAYINPNHYDPVTGRTYTPYPTSDGTGHLLNQPGQTGILIYPGFNPATAPNGGDGIAKDLSHHTLPNVPPFTANFGAQYSMPITSDWAGTLRSDFYWQDGSMARVFNDNPYDHIHGYTNVNLTLILTNQNGWQVMLYDKNVFNTTAITGDFLNSDDSGLTTNVFLTDPKLIGIRVTKNW